MPKADQRRVLLFIGDSVTDCGRRLDPEGLGHGYVREIAKRLEGAGSHVVVANRGIDGTRVRDLEARWTDDCIRLDPAVVSVLVGVNDTWRRYDSDDATSAAAFQEGYRGILQRTRHETTARI